jgi:amidase
MGLNENYNRRQFLKHTAGLSSTLLLPGLTSSLSFAQGLPSAITEFSATQLSVAIHTKQVSSEEVMQAYLERIHKYNPVYNAIVSMLDDGVLLEQARDADQALAKGYDRGWMHGIPHAVKDLSDARGLETSRGSPLFAGTLPMQDSLHIARIRAQGAIFIGKTNVPEFGLGSQSYNPVHGVTRNAYDPALVAGGSSGGAACGMATQMLPAADGSDMMGSLRNPAGLNNVIGFRPSQGRVPNSPNGDLFYQQLGTSGPMGRNVEDTIRLLHSMAGAEPGFPLSLKDAIPAFKKFNKTNLSNYRVAWMGDYDGYLETETGVLATCETSLQSLSEHGVIVENATPDYEMSRLWQTWLTFRHWALGAAKPLYDDPDKRKLLKPEFIWEIEGSIDMTADRVRNAGTDRADWYRALMEMFERYDILALPSAQVFPFAAETHWPKQINGRKMDTYHRWMEVVIGGTLAGLPVVNLPAGFDQRGRPMGIQFIGRMGQDQQVLEFALAYEAVTEHLDRKPKLVTRLS